VSIQTTSKFARAGEIATTNRVESGSLSGSKRAEIGVSDAQSGLKADTKEAFQHAQAFCELRLTSIQRTSR
jgi:hypothetical protein